MATIISPIQFKSWEAFFIFHYSLSIIGNTSGVVSVRDLTQTLDVPFDIIQRGIEGLVEDQPMGYTIEYKDNKLHIKENLTLSMDGSPPKRTTKLTPTARDFISRWCVEFEKFWGRRYLVAAGKDGVAAKRLLSIDTLDNLINLAVNAWRMSQTGKYWCQRAMTIAGFAYAYNNIISELNGAVAPPLVRLKIIDERIKNHVCNPDSINYNPNYSEADYNEYQTLKTKRQHILKEISGV